MNHEVNHFPKMFACTNCKCTKTFATPKALKEDERQNNCKNANDSQNHILKHWYEKELIRIFFSNKQTILLESSRTNRWRAVKSIRQLLKLNYKGRSTLEEVKTNIFYLFRVKLRDSVKHKKTTEDHKRPWLLLH